MHYHVPVHADVPQVEAGLLDEFASHANVLGSKAWVSSAAAARLRASIRSPSRWCYPRFCGGRDKDVLRYRAILRLIG